MAGLGGSLSAALGWAYGVHARSLVAFSLDGRAKLPSQPPPTFATPFTSDFNVNPTLAQAGALVYGRCSSCHGPGAVAAGMAPDLRAAAVVTAVEPFARIVRGGARAARGMPAYTEMTDQELTALRHYIRRQANQALAKQP
jgi:quinohemoprotein ethanol dehydrogenase